MSTFVDRSETLLERWSRRALSIPLLIGGFFAFLVLSPVLFASSLLVDALRPRSLVMTRAVALGGLYLALEMFGLVASLAIWLSSGLGPTGRRRRSVRWNYALQALWAGSFFDAGRRLFGLRVHVESEPVLRRRPILLFLRHAGTADTLLAAGLLTRPHGRRLRYVLKRELLWDPCLDVNGQRLPNCFVRRGAERSHEEIARLGRLMDGLGPSEGVVIYPEGTRFTDGKRRRILESLARKGKHEELDRARAYRAVLPPRLGGPLELLARNREADVLFCAHVGLEGSSSLRRLLDGTLVGSTVHVQFWTVPFEVLPGGEEERIEWLLEQWREVDAFVVARQRDGDRKRSPAA